MDRELSKLLSEIRSEKDIDSVKFAAMTAILSDATVRNSVMLAYRDMLASAEPHELPTIERFFEQMQKQVTMGDLRVLALAAKFIAGEQG